MCTKYRLLRRTETNSSYLNTGAVANLYDGSVVRAHHFFDSQGPVFELVDGAGLVHGTVLTKQASPRQADDGGFGSVAELLLVARDGEGARPCGVLGQRAVSTLADLCA